MTFLLSAVKRYKVFTSIVACLAFITGVAYAAHPSHRLHYESQWETFVGSSYFGIPSIDRDVACWKARDLAWNSATGAALLLHEECIDSGGVWNEGLDYAEYAADLGTNPIQGAQSGALSYSSSSSGSGRFLNGGPAPLSCSCVAVFGGQLCSYSGKASGECDDPQVGVTVTGSGTSIISEQVTCEYALQDAIDSVTGILNYQCNHQYKGRTADIHEIYINDPIGTGFASYEPGDPYPTDVDLCNCNQDANTNVWTCTTEAEVEQPPSFEQNIAYCV